MVELSKKILTQVSFDAGLFQKELIKAITWIQNAEELNKLKSWCISKFGRKFPKEIRLAFAH